MHVQLQIYTTDQLARRGARFSLRDDGYFAEVAGEVWRWHDTSELFVRVRHASQAWETPAPSQERAVAG